MTDSAAQRASRPVAEGPGHTVVEACWFQDSHARWAQVEVESIEYARAHDR